MIARVVHLMRKDVGEHRAWFAAFVGLVAVRAALVGSGIDASVNDQDLLISLSLASFLLTVVDGALLVALSVQLVQGDRLVGTTAFWLTRPVRRADLVVAKIGTAVAALVLVPILFDGLAMIVSGLSWRHAAAAMAEGAALRLVVVLPAMALASVTADLAGFVVSAVGALFATLVLEAAFQWGRRVAPRTVESAHAATAVVAAVLIAGATAAFAHQVLTRRRARSAGFVAAVGILAVFAANLWTVDFISAAVFVDGTREALDSGGPSVRWRALWQSYALGQSPVEAILGGVQVLGAPAVPETEGLRTLAWLAGDRYRQYVDGRVRFEVETTLGALGYRVGAVLPLEGRATGAAGAGRFSILSASCEAGKCTVVVRNAVPASLMEYGRPSRIAYVLVNRARGLALVNGAQDYRSRVPVFGSTPILTEHVLVVHHRLVFEAPDDAPGLIDAGWQQEAAIAAVEMRDIGTFAVRTIVAGSSK